jgi:hypothetical protein
VGAKITGAAALRAVRMYRNLPEPTDLEAGRPEFSKDAFADALAELFVGDDLVCNKTSLTIRKNSLILLVSKSY